jgi:hypothetical protein
MISMRFNHIQKLGTVLTLVSLVVAILMVPRLAKAGDMDGVIGLKFKIQDLDNQVPPGDNGPMGASSATFDSNTGVRDVTPARPINDRRHHIVIQTIWAWLLQVRRL